MHFPSLATRSWTSATCQGREGTVKDEKGAHRARSETNKQTGKQKNRERERKENTRGEAEETTDVAGSSSKWLDWEETGILEVESVQSKKFGNSELARPSRGANP